MNMKNDAVLTIDDLTDKLVEAKEKLQAQKEKMDKKTNITLAVQQNIELAAIQSEVDTYNYLIKILELRASK